MNIQQMRYIIEVNKTRSISKAAANLFIAQPNLSTAISSLEQELGYPLFIRSSKGAEPTPAGRLVIEEAEKMLAHYENIINIGVTEKATHFRLGGLSYSPVANAFLELCKEYSSLPNLGLTYDLVSDNPDNLTAQSLDMMLVLIRPEQVKEYKKTAEGKNCRVTPLAKVPVVLRIGKNHPLYQKEQIHPSDLESYPFVDYASRVYSDHPELFDILTFKPKSIIMASDRNIKNRLVSEGTAFALGCALPKKFNDKFGFRNIQLGDIHYILIALTKKKQKPSQISERFMELLREELEDMNL